MPPRPKFTRDELVAAAYELARREGSDAITARGVGKRLGVSSSPIFTVFRDMEELKAAVAARAKATFDSYVAVAEEYDPAYKMRGMQWVKFAQDEPMLFRLLFMCDNGSDTDFDAAMDMIPFGREDDIAIISRDYHASPEQAAQLFRQMWIYTYGMCALCASKVCRFTDEEISAQLGEIFAGMIHVLHSSSAKSSLMPVRCGSPESADIQRAHPDLRR